MKNRLLLLSILTSFMLPAQNTDSLLFAQVYYKEAWRILGSDGNFILNQEYGVGSYQSLCFSEGLAISASGDKYGFTDFKNKQVIPNKYDAVQCFYQGYAPVAIGQKWGIINRQDRLIVPTDYDFAGSFGPEGLAGLIKDSKLGFADSSGRVVIPFNHYWITSMSVFPLGPFFMNGLIAVIEAESPEKLKEGKVGFMNTKGELVIKPQFDARGSFSGLPMFMDGKATVFKNDKPLIIDTLGRELLEPAYGKSGWLYFEEGFSVIYSETGHQGIMAENGTVILEPKYNGVNSFSEGFAAVQISGDENGVVSGFVNKKGEFVFNRTFGFVRDFREGLAAVEIKGKWGFIDTAGRLVIEPQFVDAKDFDGGLAIVAIKKGKTFKYGFIDRRGKFVLPPVYNEANEFKYGLAPVKIGNKFGYINRKGEVIIQPRFGNALSFQKEAIGQPK